MNELNSIPQKKSYCIPAIKRIKLDKEISLVLLSEPPVGPNESIFKAPEYFNLNPFINNILQNK